MLRAIGLMSGTSLDGADAALLRTDGQSLVEPGPALTLPYAEPFRGRLRGILGLRREEAAKRIAEIERELTELHAEAVRRLLAAAEITCEAVDVVGFHGQTILHRPSEGLTVQIGDGALLAGLVGIDVVDDFRSQDAAHGGQGAPLVPLYHAALAAALPRPLAVVNLGGVANVTWIGEDGPPVAFDTGPGNALLDDWVRSRTGRAFDDGGALAAAGRADAAALDLLLAHPYFERPPPKSLDRGEFDLGALEGLSVPDGAATLVAFTVEAVRRATRFFPAEPRRWLVAGGGRHNRAVMVALKAALEAPVEPVEAAGWNGDALEAQAFAYLAVRSLKGLPLTLPTTTGVAAPMSGGRLHRRPPTGSERAASPGSR